MFWSNLGGSLLLIAMFGLPILHFSTSSVDRRNLHVVEETRLIRSGQLPKSQFERLVQEQGVRTVITFRGGRSDGELQSDDHEEVFCREHDIAFYRITPKAWVSENGRIPAEANVEEFLRIVDARRDAGPIYMHCFAGLHRTGVYAAVYRMEYNGWSGSEAVDEMLTLGYVPSFGGMEMGDYLLSYRPRAARRS